MSADSRAADRLAGERPEPLAPVADVVPITDRMTVLRRNVAPLRPAKSKPDTEGDQP